jgi:hypothetical protein
MFFQLINLILLQVIILKFKKPLEFSLIIRILVKKEDLIMIRRNKILCQVLVSILKKNLRNKKIYIKKNLKLRKLIILFLK